MKCGFIDKYTDKLFTDSMNVVDKKVLSEHIKTCTDCRRKYQRFIEQEKFVMDASSNGEIPQHIAVSILNHIDKGKYNKHKLYLRRKYIAAAILLIALSLSAYFLSYTGTKSNILLPSGKKVHEEQGIENKKLKNDIEYGIFANDRYIGLLVKNNTDKDIELIYPTTHTFDFRLYKNGSVIWDSYKDDETRSELNWETHQTIKANEEAEIGDIWYESIPKGLNGVYSYEFYSTNSNLKSAPHLTGTIEFDSSRDGISRSKTLIFDPD